MHVANGMELTLPSTRRLALALFAGAAAVVWLRARARATWLQQREWAREPAAWTRHLMTGGKKPAGMPVKDFMYECFRRDVERGRPHNADIPHRPSAPRAGMRVVTFNDIGGDGQTHRYKPSSLHKVTKIDRAAFDAAVSEGHVAVRRNFSYSEE